MTLKGGEICNGGGRTDPSPHARHQPLRSDKVKLVKGTVHLFYVELGVPRRTDMTHPNGHVTVAGGTFLYRAI